MVMVPTVGQRAADRVTLAAGVVLGVVTLVALRTARRGLGALWQTLRG